MQFFNEIINSNRNYILEKNITKNHKIYLEKIVNHINKEKIIIITGLKNIGKTEIISDFIAKTKIQDRFFYFNKDLDFDNIIKDNYSLDNLFNVYLDLYKNTKYIILQNISQINGIKEFLGKIHKSDYKIIIIGNDIKIPNITEIEIKNNLSENIENDLLYGNIGKSYQLTDTIIKKEYIKLIVDNIFLNKIINLKLVKNIFLYKLILTKIAKLDCFIFQRELHRNIEETEKIALRTFMDYIDFSIQEKIIYKIELYDFKKEKIILNKYKYFFSDNGIRNSLSNFNLDKNILIENLIFIKLNYNNYLINGGLNGIFEFSFIATKNDTKIYIHISKETERQEINKEMNKLQKVPGKAKRYLVINNIDKLNLKKYIYDDVELIGAEELLKKSL
ncbi:MAG: AAA family ATPase [Candidatus Gracilibacteria bacterium]|nr:AAA family ATPase [Candidatus Gracilibacteria bacterium]